MCVIDIDGKELWEKYFAFASIVRANKDDLYLNGRVNQFRKKNFENNNDCLDDSWHLNNVSVEMEEDVDNL